MNGFQVSDTRKDMYNKKTHRKNAEALGCTFPKEGTFTVGSGARKVLPSGRGRAFKQHYESKFGRCLYWLSLHEEGWHYGHTLTPAQFQEAKRRQRLGKGFTDPTQLTFQVRQKFKHGYGTRYPYHHNYHHIIPTGAFHQFVIGMGDDAGRRKRIKIVIASCCVSVSMQRSETSRPA